MIKIYVKTREKGTFQIDINSASFVGELKHKIQKKEGTSTIYQIILFNDEYLDDDYNLKQCSLKNGSTVYLFNKKKSLLLRSSNIFNNSTIIDRIRQSCIDLEIDSTKDEVINLLNEAAFYLDKIFDVKAIQELFSLILCCFQHFPEQSLEIISKQLSKKSISNNLYIITTSALSFLNQNHPEISIKNFEWFISKVRNEILPQIQNRKKSKLILYYQEVDPLLQPELISDIALLSELTEKDVLTFYPIILNSNLFSKINLFIRKVSNSSLLKIIPEEEFLKNDLFLILNPENLSVFISMATEQTFRKILPQIGEMIIPKTHFLPLISDPIIEKCFKFDIKMASSLLFDYFTNIELLLKNWDYFIKYKLQLPENFTSKITTFPKSPILLKVISHVENLPEEILSFALNEAEDIESYELAFKSSNITSPVLSTLEFWKHILEVVSNSAEDSVSKELLMQFAIYLEMNIPLQKFDEFFDHLIFDNFPPNKRQSLFLVSLFQCLKEEYRTVLLEENINEQRIDRFFNQKIIPPYCLYRLFNFVRAITKYKPLGVHQLYALYLHDSNKLDVNLASIEFDLKEESHEFLIEFIKRKNDLDMLTNIDDESTLLFIVNSLVFGSKNIFVSKFNGITKENILPIIAIVFNSNPDGKDYSRLKPISYNNFELLIESCDLLTNDNVPQIYIESINAILSCYNCLFDKFNIYFELSFKLIETLLISAISNKYKADKNKLISIIFKLSCDDVKQTDHEKTLLLFQRLGIALFKFLLQNKKEINDNANVIIDDAVFSHIKKIFLNLNFFDTNELKKAIIDEIQQPDNDDVDDFVQTVQFLNDFCSFMPELKFDDLTRVKKIFSKLLNEEKWTDLMKVIQFGQKNKLKIGEFAKIDDFIEHILNDPDLESHQFLFDVLFNIIMEDSYFANKYATYFLEKYSVDITINPNEFLQNVSYVYNEFKSTFDHIFDQLYAFFPKENFYDYRILIVRKMYKPLNYSSPKINCSFIKKLIDEKTFHSFLCLHKIASYFPFMFDKQFFLIINALLPTLNYLHLLFDPIDDQNVIDMKTFYSAFSFLVSCLYSTDFFSSFCFWLFENFTKLSDDQVFCMSIILYSLFQSDIVYKSVLSLAYKYSFLDIMIDLMNRNVKEGRYKDCYLNNLSKLSSSYICYFYSVSKFTTFVFFNMVKNDVIKNPFELEFNNFTATPMNIKPKFELIHQMDEFYNAINEKHPFMIGHSKYRHVTYEVLSKFFENFKSKEVEYVKTKGKKIPYLLTIKMVNYLCYQPKWVFDYFFDYKTFAKTPDHFQYLEQVANTVIKMDNKKNRNDELCPTDFNPINYFTSEICHEKFSEFLINQITKDEFDYYFYDLISLYARKEYNLIYFLDFITQNISIIESNLKMFNRISHLFERIIESTTLTSKFFFEFCGHKFINIALSPFFRFNESSLANLTNILCLLGENLPINTMQVIGFICALHPNLTNKAMVLCEKLTNDKAVLAFNLMKKMYENEKKKEQPNSYVIKCFFEKNRSLMKDEIPFLFKILPNYITKYEEEHYSNDDLYDLICLLFNFLAPKRINERIPIKIESTDSILYPPSNSLIQTSKDFWINIYEKHRSFLSEMIQKNELNFDRFSFLLEFHELVSFQVRLKYFKRKAKEMLIPRSKFFDVRRSNIVEDTFKEFQNHKPEELLWKFNVYFIGEYGIDAGGLTREWFSCLIKELFNPDFGLFIKCGNESYFPSSLSYINSNHINYFKFTGQIIALALIKNQCVNAHLSLAFIRQILHQDIVFKDLENYDESLMRSLQMILDVGDVKSFDLYFSIDDDQFGKIVSVDLIKDGSKTAVTNLNRNEYVNLYADYKLRKSVIKQISAFCEGFDEIAPPKLIQLFSPSELDLMICGIPRIDLKDMKKFTSYNYPYNNEHPVIKMFFKVLTKWSHENLAKLLLFITGSSQVPVNGFRDFLNLGNPICIAPGGGKDRLPVAHTCSNMLCLPYYDNENDMNNKLLIAIQHCEFGLK